MLTAERPACTAGLFLFAGWGVEWGYPLRWIQQPSRLAALDRTAEGGCPNRGM